MGYEIQLKTIRNLTSGIDILPTADRYVDVAEFGPTDIACELPKTRVAAGQLVSVSGRIVIDNQVHAFDATGKIQKSEATDAGVHVHILLRQFDKELWARFQDGLRRRQERVSQLLTAMKGEES